MSKWTRTKSFDRAADGLSSFYGVVLIVVLIVLILKAIGVWDTSALPYATGDANHDGRLSSADLVLIRKQLSGEDVLSRKRIRKCDMNDNGQLDRFDLETVTQRIKDGDIKVLE